MQQKQRLYIIGNGFDIFHGLPCRYTDFRKWLQQKRPQTFSLLNDIYSPDGEWWKDFEVNLGNLDILKLREKFYTKYTAHKRKEYYSLGADIPISVRGFHDAPEYYSGEKLKQLYAEIDDALKQWIDEIEDTNTSTCKQKLYLNPDSFFISFNYTSLLEDVYNIPPNNVLYIHGNSKRGEKLILGHNKSAGEIEYQYQNKGKQLPDDQDMQQILLEYGSKEKNPYKYIHANDLILSSRPLADCVIVLGLSFSPVDEYYFSGSSGLVKHISTDAQWFISWYSEQDKTNIEQLMKRAFLGKQLPKYNFIQISDLQYK